MRSATEWPTPSSFCSSLAEAVLMLILSWFAPTAARAVPDSVTTAASAGVAPSAASRVKATMRRTMLSSWVRVHCALEPSRAAPLHGARRVASMSNVPDVAARRRHDGYTARRRREEAAMLKDFRAFLMRGNVVDLAVAVVIGAAFGAIVTSFVSDILMPPIGRVLGRANFADLFVTLSGGSYPSLAAAKVAGAATLNYGVFINTIINFVIVAFAGFVLVRQIDRIRARPTPPSPSTKECPQCATAIPLRALRCPHCTSNVGGPDMAPHTPQRS